MNFKSLLILYLSFIASCDGQNTKRNNFNDTQNNHKELKCGDITFNHQTKNLWSNFKIHEYSFSEINSKKHLYFIDDCKNIITSADKRIYLFREVLSDTIQNSYDYYEAPYIAVDVFNQNYASYASVINKKVTYLSLTNAKAEFVNNHDFIFEQNVYKLTDDLLKEIPTLVKKGKINIITSDLEELIYNEPLSEKNIKEYNDIAFYLGENKKSNEAIFLLNEITNKYPERVVAWLNIADNYWNLNNRIKAKSAYQKYISLMKSQRKDSSKIPKRAVERLR
ncbi:tetratricopeptide repeat protein [Chryseobacterium vrystaatense]|uniref:Tetratricopeptide repeat-containing protein n=1 Tax=Chryseobacterium vrystaatense TaxID=307480 RepID=A0A1M5ILB2_9FLAO|nr:hypothetical protein [Chryseobacterium vrystaatense]SHG29077.1 hypothetical protein SAMN02787073_3911 [Chryseobacterium vrystaatense]